jgi:CRP/FNR family transcriptional regulator
MRTMRISRKRARAGPTSVTSAEVLRRVPYFASLPATELRRLAARCSVRRLGSGEALFEEGEPCRGLLIVADGRVEVRQISLRGREQVFHSEGPGATLGEGPLFDGGGYIASAVALAPTRVLFLPRAEVFQLCRRYPAVALAMLKTLARRVRHFAGIVSDLAFRPVAERLARHLEASVAGPIKSGTSLELTLTQAQLAARLGTVRELVTRAFSQLEERGVISRERSRVTVRDPARLAALARGDEDAGPATAV